MGRKRRTARKTKPADKYGDRTFLSHEKGAERMMKEGCPYCTPPFKTTPWGCRHRLRERVAYGNGRPFYEKSA